MIHTIGIIGSGKVAKHLALLFANLTDIELKFVAARNQEVGQQISNSCDCAFISLNEIKNTPADCLLVAITDDSLKEIDLNIPERTIIAHTSGSVSMDVFSSYRHYGVFYPLQTFTEQTVPEWNSIPLLIEGNSDYVQESLLTIGNHISNRVLTFSSDQRKQLHLAAVISCNFSNYLWTLAQSICDKHDIPFDLLLPLIEKTAENIQVSPPRNNQTGPAIRKDHKTIELHSNLLANKKDIQSLYLKLTQLIQEEHKL